MVLKPAPETPSWESEMLKLPELARVRVFVLLVPTVTLPKLRLPGVAES